MIANLKQNHSNPFGLSTNFRFTLSLQDHVTFKIYDCSGRLVWTMVNDVRPAGEYSLVWDGRNQRGHRVTSGSYYYELLTGGVSNVKRMILLR
jgi:flagellar hook assembly protein FlgD